LRNLRSLHTYKIQGILFSNEKIKLKPGKKKQS
jgi:ribosomal protein L6P/L9E